MSDLEAIVANVDASMKMEGMPLTDEDKKRILDCLSGKTSFELEIKKIIDNLNNN